MNPDFIGVIDDALPSNICNEIIKYIDGKQLVQGGYGDGQIDLKYKDVQEVRPVPFLDDGSIVSEHLTKSLKIFVDDIISIIADKIFLLFIKISFFGN